MKTKDVMQDLQSLGDLAKTNVDTHTWTEEQQAMLQSVFDRLLGLPSRDFKRVQKRINK